MRELFDNLPDLNAELARLLVQIPRGQVTTYGSLAAALGSPNAAKWIGWVLLHHVHTRDCVCHRVLRSTGYIGEYGEGGVDEKMRRLRREGIEITGQMVDLAEFGVKHFDSRQPLRVLAERQTAMLRNLSLARPKRLPSRIGAVDVSYAAGAGEDGNAVVRGIGAYVVCDLATASQQYVTMIEDDVTFPYISSFLTFRELPLQLELLDAAATAGEMADVILVDGTGILHPRRAGIATSLGIVADLPTIGVTKKLLCGRLVKNDVQPGEAVAIEHDGEPLGVAIRPRETSNDLLYVSPGHKIDLNTASEVVQRMLVGHKLPEPIYLADRLSRSETRRRGLR